MSKITSISQARRQTPEPPVAESPWGRVRHELHGAPHLRRADIGGTPIHPAWCTCRACLQRDAMGYSQHQRALRAWAILFIGLGATLYGLIFASMPKIAAAFGWGF